jgi:L-amino acid N-acyltransferase YncA
VDYTLSPISENDRKSVINIFNYYIENTFAAYPEQKVSYDFFDVFLKLFQGYPSATVQDKTNTVVGFGFLRAYHPSPTFSQTAEITYFIAPNYTRKGIGKRMLAYLIAEAGKKKIDMLLANISSLNPASIAFHLKQGFAECGRFHDIGVKNGKKFDIVWMQKKIPL